MATQRSTSTLTSQRSTSVATVERDLLPKLTKNYLKTRNLQMNSNIDDSVHVYIDVYVIMLWIVEVKAQLF